MIFRELQNVLTFGYLCLVIIGMLFESIYYLMFDINIFEYSDILDFLLAPFRRPITIVFLAISILTAVITFTFDRFLQRKTPKLYQVMYFGMAPKTEKGRQRFRTISVISLFIMLNLAYALTIGSEQKQFLKTNPQPNVRVNYFGEQEPTPGYKIGMNSNYLFVYTDKEEIEIIPIDSNIKSITPLRSKQ